MEEDYISILKRAQEQLTSKENTVSIKDLTLCPRVFSIIDPVPMTTEELYEYVTGQTNHNILQRLFMMNPTRFRSELQVQYQQARVRIDIYDNETGNVIDIKTSRSQRVLLTPFKFHEKQLKYYMAIMASREGQIIYQMNNFGKYRAFAIHMTEEERKKALEELKSDAQSLRNAIDSGNPFLVRGIDNDKDLNWMCKKCPYTQKCLSNRNIGENISEEVQNVRCI